MTVLADNRYGKSQVRLVTVRRKKRHQLKDVTVAIRLSGSFGAAYTVGDNADVLPTDTMKNTVYALAAQHPFEDIEDFGLLLAEHFLRASKRCKQATVELVEHLWERIDGDPSAFRNAGSERRTATVERNRKSASVTAGLDDLVVMKTAKSGFAGFPRDDRYTTLKETTDRIFATSVRATWRYATTPKNYGKAWQDVRRILLTTFAAHESLSVQHTLYAMGKAVVEGTEVEEIRLVMPNKHHIPVDLEPFKLANRNEVFVATAEPFGLIEGTVRRG